MNQDKYRELLEKHLIVELPAMTSPNGGLMFMQDNAICHTAKSVKVWMDENRIQSLTWPGQSPDFNPIENIWAEIQNCLWDRRDSIKDADDVWRETQKIFYNFEISYIEKLYNSLQRRMKHAFESKGNRIS